MGTEERGSDLVRNEIIAWDLNAGPGPSEYKDIYRTMNDKRDLSIRTKR